MAETCPIAPSPCAPCDFPILNLTSENEDKETFIGIAFQPNPPITPVIGQKWDSTGCISICESTISQEDADLCASRQSDLCVTSPPPPGLVSNTAQSCTVKCPDGNPFTYTVPAGVFLDTTVVGANAAAHAFACAEAAFKKLCLGPLTATICDGVAFSRTVAVTGTPRSLSFFVFSGALPDGLILTGGSMQFTISGTPTTPGTFDFTIEAIDAQGNFMRKPYTIKVNSCAPLTLSLVSDKSNWSMGDTVTLTATLSQHLAGHLINFSWAAPAVPTGAGLVSALTNASGVATLVTKRIGYGGSGGLYPFPRLYTGPVQLQAMDVTASPNITSNTVLATIATPSDVHCTDISNYINATIAGAAFTGDLIPWYHGDPNIAVQLDWVDSSAIATYSGSGQPAISQGGGFLEINYPYYPLGGPPQLAYTLAAGNINAPQGTYTLALGGGPPGTPPATVDVT